MPFCLHLRRFAIRLLCLVSLFHGAIAAPNCTVRDERGLWTVSGHFSVGSSTVSLTLPWSLYSDGAVLFQEVTTSKSSAAPEKLILETEGAIAPVEDGAAVALKPKQRERIVFTLRDKDGQALCTWAPAVHQLQGSAPVLPDGFLRGNFLSKFLAEGNSDGIFRNTGDPILLSVGGKLAAGHGIYRVDDVPAMILARTSHQVVLRDPQPKTGIRTIESQGYRITLPFVEVRFALPSPAEARSGTLRVEVSGADAVRQPGSEAAWPRPHLLLVNSSQERIQLKCGKSFRIDADHDDARAIPLTRQPEGTMTGACKFKYSSTGPADLHGLVVLLPSRLSLERLLPRIPR